MIWNGTKVTEGRSGKLPDLPFEIIEVGAVKLNENLEPVSEFSRFVRPFVYTTLDYRVRALTKIQAKQLRSEGQDFATVMRDFFSVVRHGEMRRRSSSAVGETRTFWSYSATCNFSACGIRSPILSSIMMFKNSTAGVFRMRRSESRLFRPRSKHWGSKSRGLFTGPLRMPAIRPRFWRRYPLTA